MPRKNPIAKTKKTKQTRGGTTRPRQWRWLSSYKLTPAQWCFLNEYMKNGFNAQEAYLAVPGVQCTPESASVQASEWLNSKKYQHVQLALEEMLQKRAARCQIDADRVLTELAHIAFVDIRDFYDEDGKMKPITELSEDLSRVINELEEETLYAGKGNDKENIGTLKRLKLQPKIKALENLAKHLGITPEMLSIELSGRDGGPVEHKYEMTADEASQAYMEMIKGGGS